MQCTICGRLDTECRIKKIKGQYLCPKHLTQLYRHGKFLDRTIYDANDIILYNDYAEIVLRNKDSEVVGVTTIDIEDVELCKPYKWHLKSGENTNYAITTISSNKKIFLHRLVLGYEGKADVDHIDHNGLNNRKNNLRIVSHSDNLRNQHNNRKGIKQVGSGRFQALLTYNYQGIYLGTYDTYEEALAARLQAENRL